MRRPVGVLVEPGPQSGPCPRQRLVCEFHDAVVAGHQPGGDEAFDHRVLGRARRDEPARNPAAVRLPVGRRRDQPQQQIAQQRTLLHRHPVVELLRGVGHRLPDAAGVAVARDRQRATLPAPPRLAKRVRQQRQAHPVRPRHRAPAGRPIPVRAADRPGVRVPRWPSVGRPRASRRAGTGRARPGGRTSHGPMPHRSDPRAGPRPACRGRRARPARSGTGTARPGPRTA